MNKKVIHDCSIGLCFIMTVFLTQQGVPAVWAGQGQTQETNGRFRALQSAVSDSGAETEEKEEVQEKQKGKGGSTRLASAPDVGPNMGPDEDPGETKASVSEAQRSERQATGAGKWVQEETGEMATASIAARLSVNSLGDIWDEWSGMTSFEFLDGRHGNGTKEKPYLIANKEQLMGLSELTAMGMVILDGEGVSYAGDYGGCCFALAGNIDLQGMDWIPIGFYGDSSEMPGEVPHAFQGVFDGCGHTIKNLKLNTYGGYDHVGLFGAVAWAEIRNLTIEPDAGKEIKGNDCVGVIAGEAKESVIRDVEVKGGYIRSTGVAGGAVGYSKDSVIENVICGNVKIDARNGSELIYVGGIAGKAARSFIVDCEVSTGNSLTARIQGTGYVGGITGCQNETDLYNTCVSGTIGGAGSKAIGGVTGMYSSGKIKVARFEGTIGNSRLGAMAREGTFIGTREGAATNFNYVEDVAYLFTDSEAKLSANVCGSEISDDNDYTYEAHIGFWHTDDNFYTLFQGGSGKDMTGKYFYEELEDGVLDIMDSGDGNQYVPDHFAPNSIGRPVRGYLIVVNQIDTVAGGQPYYHVAALTVRGSSQYARELDRARRGAVAAGETVFVVTAPNNTEHEKFQLEGAPYYFDQSGIQKQMSYSNVSHSYTFRMPAKDISVAADYRKVAVSVAVNPEEYRFTVTQTRNGNRKNPSKVTEIKNREGKLIARYINNSLEQGTSVQPVSVSASVDGNHDVKDSKVRWSIDDPELVMIEKNDDEDKEGYTEKSAGIMLNLNSRFFTDIIEEAENKQSEEAYQYRIKDTIYGAGHQNGGVAVLTAQTRPSASFEGKPCSANCRIQVTFQIIDQTFLAVERAGLDKQSLDYTVTRTLTGNRLEPKETVTVTPPQSLTASFTPAFFSRAQVIWSSSDPAVAAVSPDGDAYREASVSARKDAKWIRMIMEADDAIREADPYACISGSGQRTEMITVNGTDHLGGDAKAQCEVTVHFKTDDQTKIMTEGVRLDFNEIAFDLSYEKAGDMNSETLTKAGFDAKKLRSVALPDLDDIMLHRPYNRTIVWTSSDPQSVAVDDQGNVTPVDHAPWIREALLTAPYHGEKTAEVTARTADGQIAVCTVSLIFQAKCLETDRDTERFEIVMTKTGPRFHPTITFDGGKAKKINAFIYPDDSERRHVVWQSSRPDILSVNQSGEITPIIENEKQEIVAGWILEAQNQSSSKREEHVTVTASTSDGRMSDHVEVSLLCSVLDQTYIPGGGSSGNSSGGGAAGKSSMGITPSGKTIGSAGPSGSVTGTWTQTANGRWLFASGRTYADEWAFISNPYAGKQQPNASWFRFDKDGFMVTGWFSDQDGMNYYLNPSADGTQGQMATGWQQINGDWYYFNPVSDGKKGCLLKNTVIDGGYKVDEKGRWVVTQ